jgi:hypothetical protein
MGELYAGSELRRKRQRIGASPSRRRRVAVKPSRDCRGERIAEIPPCGNGPTSIAHAVIHLLQVSYDDLSIARGKEDRREET